MKRAREGRACNQRVKISKGLRVESNCRHEDFQSSASTETICHHWSLLVSIQAFNGGLSRSILPIRTQRQIVLSKHFQSSELFRGPLASSLTMEGVCSAQVQAQNEHTRGLKSRPSSCGRPLQKLISRKADLYITILVSHPVQRMEE
jgi:hypothetical protein